MKPGVPTFAACLALGLAGCATRSTDVAPLPASPAEFATWDCARIDDETDAVQQRAADVAYSVDQRAGGNIVALGVGLAVFWPAILAMRPGGLEAAELARLKGRFEALREAAALARCPPASLELPAARAATLPVAAGDRLVYEERPDRRHAATEQTWSLRALRREEIEYVALPAAPPAAPASAASGASSASTASATSTASIGVSGASLRHDRAGNVVEALPGMLMWPHLLRVDLELGQVMAGEIQVVGDPLARARVRAQVVALGPQEIAGRHFDAAVLELFGDVLQGAGSTRLGGALVIDRSSGVLLRLDLRSAQAPFRVMRRLARVERAEPAPPR